MNTILVCASGCSTDDGSDETNEGESSTGNNGDSTVGEQAKAQSLQKQSQVFTNSSLRIYEYNYLVHILSPVLPILLAYIIIPLFTI